MADMNFTIGAGNDVSDWHDLRDELEVQFDDRLHVFIASATGALAAGSAQLVFLQSDDSGATMNIVQRENGALAYDALADPTPFDGQVWLLSPHWFAALSRVSGEVAVGFIDAGGALVTQTGGAVVGLRAVRA